MCMEGKGKEGNEREGKGMGGNKFFAQKQIFSNVITNTKIM